MQLNKTLKTKTEVAQAPQAPIPRSAPGGGAATSVIGPLSPGSALGMSVC